MIHNPLTLDDCWLLHSFPWLPSEIKAAFTAEERQVGGPQAKLPRSLRSQYFQDLLTDSDIGVPFWCETTRPVAWSTLSFITRQSFCFVATPARHFLPSFYLEMIKKNKKPGRAEGLMVGPDDTDGDAAVPSTQMFSPSS